MPLPRPSIGLVIRYSYLWWSESEAGREDGVKDRPCAVVLAVEKHGTVTEVVVAPITHSPPSDPALAVPLPSIVKRRLGLDEESSWILAGEVNRFTWPGSDLRPIGPGGRYDYGFLPNRIFRELQRKIREVAAAKRLRVVRRTD